MDKNLKEEAANKNTSGERLEELTKINKELAAIVAQNHAAPPQLLAQLYSIPNQSIRKSLAQNPNTPIKLLWQLGIDFPQALLSNPILITLRIENPDSLKQIPVETLIQLLKYEQVPTLWLDFASEQADKKIALSMLMNPKTSLNQLNNLFKLFDEASELYYDRHEYKKAYQDAWEVLYSIDYHINWGQELKEEWQEEAVCNIIDTHYCDRGYGKYLKSIFQFEIDNLLINIVNNSSFNHPIYKNVCSEILKKLLKFLQKESKFSLARNSVDVKILTELLTDEDRHFNMTKAMLENPNLPQKILVEILEVLIVKKDSIKLINDSMFRQVLIKAKIPNDLLEKIANKKDYEWKLFVTEYPNTPVFILEKYAQSLNNQILVNVASHPNTPQKILCQLAVADNWSIKYAVAQNPNTPKAILKNLTIQNRYSFNSSLANNSNIRNMDFWRLARNDNTPTEVLETVALLADDYRVRIHVVLNENVTTEILQILAKDSDYEVRYTVARNKKTPISILEKLAEDSDDEVRYAILTNPNLAKKHFLQLFRKIYGIENNSLGCLIALLDYNVSPKFLDENADSLLWIERYVIAIHPKTSPDTLQRLTQDANGYVRAAIAMHQQFKITQ
ncbi:hypothetical protein NIES4071_89330 [Calothrix sp. NIES-4071]|nr:hypothetical protein NIES4071_89330 [Calothrix sp. NIES-4071]BAZ63200.1 hypothetical protein NIES4105_89260 [Calothrix sp. NIES-4105]